MYPTTRVHLGLQQSKDATNQQELASSHESTTTIGGGLPRGHDQSNSLGPLEGIPVAVKDDLNQVPYPTSVGTAFLGSKAAREDARVIQRLHQQGALLVGECNMHEVGIGVTGINPNHGACRNPFDTRRFTGGSSSGSAAAVAAGLCPIALGGDGGGSIRIPAALCGVVGLKPTFGVVSGQGAAPLCWSVAHVGPIAAAVQDCLLGYSAITEVSELPDPARVMTGNLKGVRLGVFRAWFEDADDDVVERCDETLRVLPEAGATVVPIEIPELNGLRLVHLVTISVEIAAAQSQYWQQKKHVYGGEARLSLALARASSGVEYVHAQRHRARVCAHFHTALKTVDAIVTPTTACVAQPIRSSALACGESDLDLLSRIMRFAVPANLTGLPAVSFPAGYDRDGMPVGLQAMGRSNSEELLLLIARAAEKSLPARKPAFHQSLLRG